MTTSTLLSSFALDTIVLAAGAMIGTIAAALATRQFLLSRRTLWFQYKLVDTLGDLEIHRFRADAVNEAMSRDAELIQRVERFDYRRRVFYRLLLGYSALLALALLGVILLGRLGGVSAGEVPVAWFLIGLAAALAVNFGFFYAASIWRIGWQHPSLSAGPITIEPAEPERLRSTVALGELCKRWYRAQDYEVSPAEAASGFDLFARRGPELHAIEVKSGPRLTYSSIDTMVGAAVRAERKTPAPTKIVLFAPRATLARTPPSALAIAGEQGFEILAVEESGEITPFSAAASTL